MHAFGRAALTAGAAIAVVLGLAGCSSTVAQADVETAIKTEIDKQVPGAGPVTCPEDLAAEVGTTLRCEFQVDGQPIDAVATVTSVEGGTANYSFTTEPRPVAKALLDQKIAEQISQQAGALIDSAACAGDLPPEVGGTVRCTVTGEGETFDVDVTVTTVERGLINYSLELVT